MSKPRRRCVDARWEGSDVYAFVAGGVWPERLPKVVGMHISGVTGDVEIETHGTTYVVEFTSELDRGRLLAGP
jgi:hypothetical protein